MAKVKAIKERARMVAKALSLVNNQSIKIKQKIKIESKKKEKMRGQLLKL